jgi:hypothetical protein
MAHLRLYGSLMVHLEGFDPSFLAYRASALATRRKVDEVQRDSG